MSDLGKTWNVKINHDQRCAFGVTLTMLGNMQIGDWKSAKSCLKTIEQYLDSSQTKTGVEEWQVTP